MRFVIAVLVLASFSASAQQIHKCVGSDGVPSFQSTPCDAGQVAKGSWSAAVRDPPPAEQARRQQQEARYSRYLRNLASKHRQNRGAAAVFATPNGPGSRCAKAKAERDRADDRTRSMSLNKMDRWANYVNNACGY